MTILKRQTREERLRRLMRLSREMEVRAAAQEARAKPVKTS
jgi:hypothetical protein